MKKKPQKTQAMLEIKKTYFWIPNSIPAILQKHFRVFLENQGVYIDKRDINVIVSSSERVWYTTWLIYKDFESKLILNWCKHLFADI